LNGPVATVIFSKMNRLNDRPPRTWTVPLADLAWLTFLWLLCLFVANPVGNFPLDDDWSYGLTVKHLLESRGYYATGWESMTLIVNVLWGAAFCLLFGLSFTVLRLSTWVAAWLGMAAVYWLMRECRAPRGMRLAASLIFSLDPVYFLLSNTFMTDVLFIALLVLSGVFFLRDLKCQSPGNLFLATLLSLAAVMSRQVGLAVPLAFAVVSMFQHGLRMRTVLRAILPLALCAAALVGFECWLAATGRLPALYNFKNAGLIQAFANPAKLAGVFAHSSYLCLMYVALYLSPFLLLSLRGYEWRDKRGRAWTLAVLVAFAMLTLVNGVCGKGYTMPLSTNIINKSGLGPLTLRDSFHINTTPMLPESFWITVTLLCVFAAAILIARIIMIFGNLRPRLFPFQLEGDESAGLFLLLAGIIYLAPFMVNGFFDRYLFPAVPFLMAGLAIFLQRLPSEGNSPAASKPAGVVAVNLTGALVLAGLIVFSVCGTRDYLAWNRARWAGLTELTQHEKISPSAIDGGFEFNGYYLYRPDFKLGSRSPWWIDDDLYVLAFHPATSYSVWRTYPFTHWMPPYPGKIYVLKRNPGDAPNIDSRP
jgi:hypothetical protein